MAQGVIHEHAREHRLRDRRRPDVSISAGLPFRSIVRRGIRMLEVGLSASDTVTGWPLEIPPSTPPLLLERKPSGAISSPCSEPFCAIAAKPAPISTPFTALI